MVLVFVLLFAGAVIAEVFWLIRNGWASPGRSVAYVLITDLLSFFIGSFVVFVILFVVLMMVFGSSGEGGNSPEAAYWAALIFAVIFPPALLFLSKRLIFGLLKIKSGKTAWIYSLVSSILIFLVVLVPPAILAYIF